MLEYLEIENAGPADHLRLDLAPRLNLLTGDNGLGKSFLLDVIWWSLVQKWPAEVNPKLQTGLPIFPSLKNEARVRFKLAQSIEEIRRFQRYEFFWPSAPVGNQAIVFYAHSDGSFSLFDSLRNWHGEPALPNPFPYVLNSNEVWNGQRSSDTTLCNGLIYDWQTWQKENGSSFDFLKKILVKVSPDANEILTPGNLTRISPDNAQDVPTLKMPYGEASVVHASSGMRRILAFAYLLVWTWQEHQRAARLRGLQPTNHITFLIDELDAHLHPKWQRTIVKSLMEVMAVLAPEVKVQLIAATHSPLVMASVEPFFDPEQDAWFDLDLNQQTGQVELTKRPWYRHGDADAWLKSEAFDQKSGYAPETELVLEEATQAIGNAEITREQAEVIDQKLRGLLGDIDPFWISWRYFYEDRGWAR